MKFNKEQLEILYQALLALRAEELESGKGEDRETKKLRLSIYEKNTNSL